MSSLSEIEYLFYLNNIKGEKGKMDISRVILTGDIALILLTLFTVYTLTSINELIQYFF